MTQADDLGRVVIPKEIRRTMRIREGDPLEIFTDRDGEVIFKKYSPIGELSEFAGQYAETLHKTGGLSVAICDRDAIIACAGIPKKDYTDRKLSPELEEVLEERAFFVASEDEDIPLSDGGRALVECMMPIISEGDLTGCVVSLRSDERTAHGTSSDVEAKLIQTAALFLGRQLEG